MRPLTRVGLNVCSLQHGQCSLTRHSTATLIGIGYQDPECPLSEPTAGQILFSEAWLFEAQTRYFGLLHSRSLRHRTANALPERCPFLIRCVIGLSRNNIQRKALGNRNPMFLVEKE